MHSDKSIKQVTLSQSREVCYLLEIQQEQQESRTFPLCSDLINALPQEVASNFLRHMTYVHIKAGKRLIRQGEAGNTFSFILKGTSFATIEKNSVLHRIAQLKEGDIAGEMALFGEPHMTHIVTDTDLDVLSMSKDQFESLAQDTIELRDFLSAVITRRLSTSPVADERLIGKYSIIEKIAVGGSSIIYRGVHSVLNIPVAIKMLKHELAMEHDFTELFKNEAKTIAQLNHPNIVKVYDIEERYKTIFIIMEYLDGMLLKNMLLDMPKPSLSRILDITMQVCYGLEYAHNHGIIHQDINPANIFVQSNGQVRIIDFGLACYLGCVDSNFLFPGTLFYISPEQLRGDPIDERTDIYSLGITVYEMITGNKPFSGNDMKSVMNAHMNEDIPDTRVMLPDLPDELHNFLMRSVRKDPAARYRNISEILGDLRPLAEKMGIESRCVFRQQDKTTAMFLIYQEEQQLALKHLIEEFNRNVREIGAVLKITQLHRE
jgi:CRP-like cAMP-binding protein